MHTWYDITFVAMCYAEKIARMLQCLTKINNFITIIFNESYDITSPWILGICQWKTQGEKNLKKVNTKMPKTTRKSHPYGLLAVSTKS